MALAVFCVFAVVQPVLSADRSVLHTDGATVIYPGPLRGAAETAARLATVVTGELADVLGWTAGFVPTILLVDDPGRFRSLAGRDDFVAFAVPRKRLIVIDQSKMTTDPFTPAITLKHEMAHLMLHDAIDRPRLPRWFDEGVCQWLSGGVAELMMHPTHSRLQDAVITGHVIPLDSLSSQFPDDRRRLQLAYEQSRSVVEFIRTRFGQDRLVGVLTALKNGHSLNEAFQAQLSLSKEALETAWLDSLSGHFSWFTFIATHLDAFLFVGAALLSVAGFIRYWFRKRRYDPEDDDGDDSPPS